MEQLLHVTSVMLMIIVMVLQQGCVFALDRTIWPLIGWLRIQGKDLMN
jgi:hypothetical protein